GAAFATPTATWSLAEGPGDNPLDLLLSTGGTSPADWTIELAGAPPWALAPTAPGDGKVTVHTPNGVPYDAYPSVPSFRVRMTYPPHPACALEPSVAIDLTNVLHFATASYDTLLGDISAADFQPMANRFVMLDVSVPAIRMLDLGSPPLRSGD